MITVLLIAAIPATAIITAAVQHYRYTERRDLLNRIDAAQLLTEQRQTATALVQAEEGRRLAAWGGYYQAWDNDLHYREQVLRHRADKSEDETPPPPEEPVPAEPTARGRFDDLPPASLRILAEPDEPQHFESDAIDAGLTHLLDAGDWDKALARMVALRTETGSYPVVTATWPGSGDTAIPKRGDDEMPTPLPPTKPVVPAALKPLAIRRIHEAVTAGTRA